MNTTQALSEQSVTIKMAIKSVVTQKSNQNKDKNDKIKRKTNPQYEST